MTPLGKIVRLQIQRARLKTGEKPNQVYNPVALLSVPQLTLTAQGAYTLVNDEKVLDVHHEAHPHTGNNDGTNDLSFNFTAHYAAMRAHYGDHLNDGCAGENILIAYDTRLDLKQIQSGLIIGEAAVSVRLNDLKVALPCAPFSRFAARSAEAQTVKSALQFLDHGTRGFYGTVEQEATIKVGAIVYI